MNLIKPIAKAFYLKLSVNIPQRRVLARMFFFFIFLLRFIESNKRIRLAMNFS